MSCPIGKEPKAQRGGSLLTSGGCRGVAVEAAQAERLPVNKSNTVRTEHDLYTRLAMFEGLESRHSMPRPKHLDSLRGPVEMLEDFGSNWSSEDEAQAVKAVKAVKAVRRYVQNLLVAVGIDVERSKRRLDNVNGSSKGKRGEIVNRIVVKNSLLPSQTNMSPQLFWLYDPYEEGNVWHA